MTEGFLGFGWTSWIRLAAASWLVLFMAAWPGVVIGWFSSDDTSLWVLGILFGFTALANTLPGAAAVLSHEMRQQVLTVPEAAALSSLTLSGTAGTLCAGAVALVSGLGVSWIGAGLVIGTVAFPLTFGLAFPLAVPLACGFLTWSLARRNEGISLRAYGWLTGISTAGWGLVVWVGILLGHG